MGVPAWKKFENDVQKHFLERMETEPMIYHRFYDTASAQGFLPVQPGDHLVVYRGVPILIETKFSEKHESLRSCFSSHVPDEQMGSHRLWTRAGAITLLAFRGTNGHELWDGAYLADCRTHGRRLDKSERLKSDCLFEDLFKEVTITCRYGRKLHVF